jgi:hypothetical protein
MPMRRANGESRVPILLWIAALGGTGFAAGFFGPIALNPEANQGPLVGLLITGPFGTLAGLVLGAAFRFLPATKRLSLQALAASCATLGLGTLYYCLPEPKLRAYVIDAEVAACSAPSAAFSASLAEWERAVARVTWATPAADWRDAARRNVERDAGVVLTMRIARRSAIYEHRKPWNAGRLTAGEWMAGPKDEPYYARDAGGDCAAYLARGRALYTPVTDSPSDRIEPAAVWPPTDTTGFLSLMELGPVPAEYLRLLP